MHTIMWWTGVVGWTTLFCLLFCLLFPQVLVHVISLAYLGLLVTESVESPTNYHKTTMRTFHRKITFSIPYKNTQVRME